MIFGISASAFASVISESSPVSLAMITFSFSFSMKTGTSLLLGKLYKRKNKMIVEVFSKWKISIHLKG